MIKTSVLPKETLIELLFYLADNEKFPSVAENLKGGVTVNEVKTALRELAVALSREAGEEAAGDSGAKKGAHLSPRAKEIISCLSPYEGKTLLAAFGLK